MASPSSAQRSDAQSDSAAIALPHLYNVVLLCDRHTSMHFVADLLQQFFRRDEREAQQLTVRRRVVAGTYPRDIADAKAVQVIEAARLRSHPLRCVVERER